ncbi:MAG: hypothetical protein M1823_006842, partial [Watsoniomyces obsoletus]
MSSTPIKTVMVIGASGSVGPPIVEALLASGFSVSALTRTSSNSTCAAGVKVVKADYSPDSLLEAFKGQDAVVSTIATFSTQEQIKIIDAAITAKVRRFLPSEFGIDTSDAKIMAVLPPAKSKYDTVQYLKSQESTGLSWTAVIVGGFFDWALAVGAIGMNAKARHATVYDGGDIPHEVTNLGHIVRAVAVRGEAVVAGVEAVGGQLDELFADGLFAWGDGNGFGAGVDVLDVEVAGLQGKAGEGEQGLDLRGA